MDAVLAEIARLREDFNREIRLLHEDFNRLSEEQTKLRQDFNTEVSLLWEDSRRVNDRFGVILGRMGRRWGVDLERMLLEMFREVLEREGIEQGGVERFSYLDRDGSVTRLRGRLVEVDHGGEW